MSSRQPTILNVARDESLLKSRSAILEGAGYEIVPALTILDVQAACENQAFDLVILGYALPKEEKRRVIAAVRKFCGVTPILELYSPETVPVYHQAGDQLSSSGEAETLLIKLPKLTFQVIRRTIATLAQKKGTVKDVQGLLRHSRTATTTDVYMQEIPERVRATQLRLSARN
jgi:hypothetical protein